MTANDERGCVAAALRALEVFEFDCREYIDCGEVEVALGLETDDGAWYEAAGVRRLADLMEPEPERVRRDPSPAGGFQCPSCRCISETWFTTPHGDKWTEAPVYCPNCGRKVMEE